MSITELKETGGFWVPNACIDLLLPRLKAVGLAVYCALARCNTTREYPDVEGLAEICLTTRNKVENILDALLELGLLSYHDVVAVRNK